MAPAVSLCVSSAAKRARSVGWSMVKIGVRSVQSLFVRRWGSPVGDVCRRCLPHGSVKLLSSPAWKVTPRAAEGGERLWCWALADLRSPAPAAVSEGSVARSLHPGRLGRPGPAGGVRTAGVGFVADRMELPFRWVVCAGFASGWCVAPASGAPGPSETVGAGPPCLYVGWLGLGEVGSGSSCCVESGPLGCRGALCCATANPIGLGVGPHVGHEAAGHIPPLAWVALWGAGSVVLYRGSI